MTEQMGRGFLGRQKEREQEERLKEVAALGSFHREIIDLALKDKTGLLSGIKPDELDSMDLYFYRSSQRGEKTIKEIQHQLDMIPAEKAGISKRKLLNYILYLLKEKKSNRTA